MNQAELYKSGIIEIFEDLDHTDEEPMYGMIVHFQGKRYEPVICGDSEALAFKIGRNLYDWMEENRDLVGDRFSWGRYGVNNPDV